MGRASWLPVLLAACKQPDPVATGVQPDTAVPSPTEIDTDTPHTDEPPGPVWVEIGNNPCARAEDGYVHCWNSEVANAWENSNNYGPVPDSPVPMSSFYAPNAAAVVGLRSAPASPVPVNWFCGLTQDEGGSANPCAPDTDLLFSDIGYTAGLTNSGQVWWWSSDETVEPPGLRPWIDNSITYRLAAWNYSRTALLAQDNRVFVRQQHASELRPNVDDAFAPELEIVEIATAGFGVCARDLEGTVTCLGPESPENDLFDPVSFDNPPYIGVRGGYLHVCAQRADHVIECNDGSEHDFGPTRDFDVHSERPYDESGTPIGSPNPEPTLTLCVITVDNGIRCVGDRYFDDVLALLPVGDGQQPSTP